MGTDIYFGLVNAGIVDSLLLGQRGALRSPGTERLNLISHRCSANALLTLHRASNRAEAQSEWQVRRLRGPVLTIILKPFTHA